SRRAPSRNAQRTERQSYHRRADGADVQHRHRRRSIHAAAFGERRIVDGRWLLVAGSVEGEPRSSCATPVTSDAATSKRPVTTIRTTRNPGDLRWPGNARTVSAPARG